MKTVLAIAAAAISTSALASATPGLPAPGFTLTDLSGKAVNLADYKGKTVVLEWHNFECPFVQKHYKSGNMQSLQKRYANDVVWLAVSSTAKTASDYIEPASISKQLSEFKAQPARYLLDEPGNVGRAYGAKTTPHMYVIDAKGVLAYRGAIDNMANGKPDGDTIINYVDAALADIKAGKPVAHADTKSYGCSVKY